MHVIYNFDELTFQILAVSCYTHEEGTFAVKGRPYGALSFRLSGSGAFTIGECGLMSQAGDILYIPQDTDYRVTYTGGESVVVHMTHCNYTGFENVSVKNSPFFRTQFLELAENWKRFQEMNDAKASVFRLLQYLKDVQTRQEADPSFDRCLAYLNQQFCRSDLCLADICKAGSMSESSFRRKLRSRYGISPARYLIRLRLNKAMGLLVKGELSVREIARQCGFCDEKYFSRVVKKRYALPPSAFYKTV